MQECKVKYEEIEENQQKLMHCPKHYFDFGIAEAYVKGKIKCKKCGGFMRPSEILAYAKGYEASGADPNDVVKGFY